MTIDSGRGAELSRRSFGGIVFSALLAASRGAKAQNPERVGLCEYVRGEASAEGQSARRALQRDAPVFVADLVSTGPESRLTIHLGENTRLRLGERARIIIDRYLVDAGGEFRLEAGAMLFDRPSGQPLPVQVRSPFGLIACAEPASLQARAHTCSAFSWNEARLALALPAAKWWFCRVRARTLHARDSHQHPSRLGESRASARRWQAFFKLAPGNRLRVVSCGPFRLSRGSCLWAQRTKCFWIAMSNDLLVSLLAATDLFGSFSADELAACAAAFRPIRAKKGALLFTRGDAGTHLYIVVEGRVRLAITTEDGRELSFRHAAPGDLFGEIAALDGFVVNIRAKPHPRTERVPEALVGTARNIRWRDRVLVSPAAGNERPAGSDCALPARSPACPFSALVARQP